MASQSNTETATVANGCFWGTQHVFDHHLKGRLLKTSVGYIVRRLPDFLEAKPGEARPCLPLCSLPSLTIIVL